MDRSETTPVEAILRDELARETRALTGVAPVISHMLQSSGHALVNDAIVARLRGMLADLARQLLPTAASPSSADGSNDAVIDALADRLADDSALLGHLYAVAMEAHLLQRLEQRFGMDPVLSPLLQELIGSDQPDVAELAMQTMAAQSRFQQSQQRMALPVGELAPEHFASALKLVRKIDLGFDPHTVKQHTKTLKTRYDEGASRIGLLGRMIAALKGGAIASLELEHSGLSLFASGLARLSHQPRDLAVMACHEDQAARLALSLRAAGLEHPAIERQFQIIEPVALLAGSLSDMTAQGAKELLSHPVTAFDDPADQGQA